MADRMRSDDYKPLKTPPPLDPKQKRESLDMIDQKFCAAMKAAREYFLSLDEAIAGNLKLPYPPTKGTISVLQLSCTLGYHEQHHFRAMARIHISLSIPGVSD